MKTWTNIHFSLTETDDPLVSIHSDAVSLHLPGYGGDGRGFSLRVLPTHLPRLRELCAALETLASQTQHTDHNPFVHEDACPTCRRAAALEDARQDADAERYADAAAANSVHDVVHDVF
jgi:hypothetical protein